MFLKNLRNLSTNLLIVTFFLSAPCYSEEEKSVHSEITDPPTITKIQHIESIDMTQVTLSNGMTICLKSTDYENEEVFFKLAANGGYASLPSEHFASGKLADQIAWESGIGGMTSDQVSLFLYQHSLEFALSIQPFSRVVEAEGSEQSIEAFCQCIKMLFTEQQFTEEGLKLAKILSKDTLTKLQNDNDQSYESIFLKVNTQNFKPLAPLDVADLNHINFQVSKDFFQRCFSDPKDFFCFIIGAFDIKKTIKLIEHYLGEIPKAKISSNLKKNFSIPFPPGKVEKTIKLKNSTSCLTHMTFPLQMSINDLNIHPIIFMCQVIEARLRQVITNKMNLSYGVDVSYEFPAYPLLNNPWVSIRYRTENKLIHFIKDIILKELQLLQSNGITALEMDKIKKLEEKSQEFWLRDNFYWISMLTSYYLWGWNPEKIDYKNSSIDNLSAETINRVLKQSISINNFSVVTAIPNN